MLLRARDIIILGIKMYDAKFLFLRSPFFGAWHYVSPYGKSIIFDCLLRLAHGEKMERIVLAKVWHMTAHHKIPF